jgi:predicted GIY-YIG superfamily endonuclease
MFPLQAIFCFVVIGFLIGFLIFPANESASKKNYRETSNNYVSASNIKHITNLPGVYFIVDSSNLGNVYYVGSSKNIYRRFQFHTTFQKIVKDKGVDNVGVTWLTCAVSETKTIEQEMINKFVGKGMAKYNRLLTVT